MDSWQIPAQNFNLRLHKPYPLVLEAVTSGLRYAGFVVATEIDIKETLKRNLNVDALPFKIMRVYNPRLTTQAHTQAPNTALLLYNITITQMEDGSVEVSVVDPLPVQTVVDNPAIQSIVLEAHQALQTMVNGL